VIHGWVRTNFGSMHASAAARLELDRALQKTAGFFRKGGRLNVQDICREIAEIAPMVGRIEIMDLCLRVAGAKGQVTSAEILLLKDLAGGLAIDRARLRAMVEKALPCTCTPARTARSSSALPRHEQGPGPPPVEPRVRQMELAGNQHRPGHSQAGRPDAQPPRQRRTQYVGVKPVPQKT